MKPKKRDVSDSSHEWDFAPGEKWEFCLVCGNVRRADRQNARCKGVTRITTREAQALSDDADREMGIESYEK